MALSAEGKKAVNNGGFAAILAIVLAQSAHVTLPVRIAANLLHVAADTYSKMLATIGVSVKLDADWEGCDQAKLLIAWINGTAPEGGEAMQLSLLKKWTADIWAESTALANGKVPQV
jgi:hypothetical protein